MDMEESVGLSQGVFVDRPRRIGKRDAQVDTFGDFQPPVETICDRVKLYRSYHKRVKYIIEELENEWNSSLANQVGSFIEQSMSLISCNETVTPLGFVPSGLSQDENSRLFDYIVEEVEDRLPLLARVNSCKCPNVKMAFQNICKQLLRNNANASQFHDITRIEALDDTIATREVSSSSRYLSIHDLQKWYDSRCPKKSLIGIVLEDADYFPPCVIPQLLHLLSSSKLPILFLLGGNHFLTNFGRFIPQNAATAFNYTTFRGISATHRLNECIKKILSDEELAFKLSGPILQYLSSFFLCQHFSLTRFVQAYQICLMDHFQKAESIFCTNDVAWDSKTSMSSEVLRTSYEPMIETAGCQHQLKGRANKGKDSVVTEIQIKERIKTTQLRMQEWSIVLNLLHCVKRKISADSFFANFRELYIECATGSFFEPTEETESQLELMLKDINLMSKSTTLEMLKRSIQEMQVFRNKKEKSGAAWPETIPDFVGTFLDFQKQVEEDQIPVEKEEKNEISFKGITKLRDLQKKILTSKVDGGFNNIKSSFAMFIRETMKKYLKPLSSIPGSGVFVYQNLTVLKSLFSPHPQSDIVSALRIPGAILECDCCKETEATSIDSNLPDTSILFKLLQEQMAKKVDINSIYESFASFVETRKRNGTKKSEESSGLCLLRFRQALGELQHLGVVKRNKSKPDEVTKLLWL